MARKWIDRFIYNITRKPIHYREVKNPPKTTIEKLLRPQDARQVQYNNWSKARGIYSGSYLPKDGQKLETQGWVNETSKKIDRSNPKLPRTYRRKSTNQWVRDDRTHWHWYNWWQKKSIPKSYMRGSKSDQVYLDKYGEPCVRGSEESHIKGED